MLKRFLSILVPASLLAGCSTDLDINAPYKEITVMYGLLDKNADTNFVKINRAFLGTGDAFVYAQVPDSNEYTSEQMQAEVQRLNANGEVTNTYALQEIIKDRAPGLFYGPQHKLYYFTVPGGDLDPNSRYRIVANVKGQRVEAATPVVNDVVPNVFLTGPSKLGLMTSAGSYATPPIRWVTGLNGKRFEVSFRFHWDDVIGEDTVARSFEAPIGTAVAPNTTAGQPLELEFNGQNFFQSIGINVHEDPSVSVRIFRGVDLIWAAAASDLHVYLELASPISGVVEERPQYTNVTNGYGLVSSRAFFTIPRKDLSDPAIGELINGQYTGSLRFCIENGSEPVACP